MNKGKVGYKIKEVDLHSIDEHSADSENSVSSSKSSSNSFVTDRSLASQKSEID